MSEFNYADGIAFTEAIEYAEARGVVLPEIYYGLLVGIQKSQATTIAGLASLEQIKFVIDLVTEALKDGTTFADFKKAVRKGDVNVNLPAHRLDNIFRTNIQTAYNRGRWEQQKKVANSRPYLMYDAINDSRTRPNHTAMDGTILHRDDPWWKTHYPPNGYRCRCTVIALTEAQARKRGISGTPPDAETDDGWEFNPGIDYQVPLSKALDSFGADLVNENPRLHRAVEEAKARIRSKADEAKSDRADAPKAK